MLLTSGESGVGTSMEKVILGIQLLRPTADRDGSAAFLAAQKHHREGERIRPNSRTTYCTVLMMLEETTGVVDSDRLERRIRYLYQSVARAPPTCCSSGLVFEHVLLAGAEVWRRGWQVLRVAASLLYQFFNLSPLYSACIALNGTLSPFRSLLEHIVDVFGRIPQPLSVTENFTILGPRPAAGSRRERRPRGLPRRLS